jgi:aspartyl-tRNA(Asn)/glutamyl-tRNA(Gln) amidotransferase subunit B
MDFETVIGLEVHIQLKTKSKIFCGCSTAFGAPPNSNVCPVCLGLPGVLPVLNKKVVEFAIKLGLATNAEINHVSEFARKNYFYPDLPKGYQTSQFDKPIVGKGWIDIDVDGKSKRIGITRIHMEEDAGKLLHDAGDDASWVDLNRTGVPLLEIVSEPDMRSPEEAVAYLKKLHAIVRYLDICDGNMQEGSFRCDANISLRPAGQEEFGTRTELKNMNSFRHVASALEHEIRRQRDLLLEGGVVVQETRLWNPDSGITESMRGKEDAHDYRYFPCPDLIPVELDQEWIERIRATIPELPDRRKQRFVEQLELPEADAVLLTSDRELAEYFEATLSHGAKSKKAANWIMTELLKELKGEPISSCRVLPQALADLLALIEKGTISGKIAKEVFTTMMESGEAPSDIVSRGNLAQVSDEDEILRQVREIIAAHPGQAEEFRGGKSKLLGFFVGQLMQRMKGKANPAVANELFLRELGS